MEWGLLFSDDETPVRFLLFYIPRNFWTEIGHFASNIIFFNNIISVIEIELFLPYYWEYTAYVVKKMCDILFDEYSNIRALRFEVHIFLWKKIKYCWTFLGTWNRIFAELNTFLWENMCQQILNDNEILMIAFRFIFYKTVYSIYPVAYSKNS